MVGLLQVVIGIVFMLLLLSLLATTIMELISSIFALRGKNLETALCHMLSSADKDGGIYQEFKNNPLYKQLCQRYGAPKDAKLRPPSYLNPDTFHSIVMAVVLNGEDKEKLQEKINQLPDEDLKKVLQQLLNDADYELDHFKEKVNQWFNDVMDRASGWFKRHTQQLVVGIGMVIAVGLNADTLAIYQRLEADPVATQQLVTMAEQYVSTNDSLNIQSNAETREQVAQVNTLVTDQLAHARSPLGLGWYPDELKKLKPVDWGLKILGWLITALAISLGAPFWFDVLKRLVNIRSSGNAPSK
jgi:ElaB/YqjD/DUF883 family membrane-anchored ribosome-binding protein